jgi:hypothetical protein
MHSSDYDTSDSIEARKRDHTYGLTPPAVESFENQTKRCEWDIGGTNKQGNILTFDDQAWQS